MNTSRCDSISIIGAFTIVLSLLLPLDTPAALALEGCPLATDTVADTQELEQALARASPGTVIGLSDGTYNGNWEARVSGTPARPIWLCGGSNSVLTNDGDSGGYGLHLNGASYWHLYGFSVTNAQKGVVADEVAGVTIENLTVHGIGDEALHLRKNSTSNLITKNTVYDTGQRREKFGEGVYIGSSDANWGTVTGGNPDRSDFNTISYNTIYATTAEAIDVKEGTGGGLVLGNNFNGNSITSEGGDSWVDIKGNDWKVIDNTGVNSPGDGFQTHHRDRSKDGLGDWGLRNVFESNNADVKGPGYGFYIHDAPTTDNVVSCSNHATNAGLGFANLSCSS
ncbi:right-handed parallel beta-helix repeat-containing protein [Actinomadura litoris]|uniref:right-handed parallel beta-helix repeat-containing protein n=1 Tax=Actinomadura litoris TaxID=2678616 RepID=UPI001FA6FB73|nr:right-handed parallel beta-helix repeat-containing protein [Actinomadura litoris]